MNDTTTKPDDARRCRATHPEEGRCERLDMHLGQHRTSTGVLFGSTPNAAIVECSHCGGSAFADGRGSVCDKCEPLWVAEMAAAGRAALTEQEQA